jgi:anthranilate phosphoribosyltransferase
VLEALEVRIDSAPDAVQRSLDEMGWAFLFAPGFHASTRHAVAPRRELGIRTAFNLLGPLTNPARPAAQVVGVPRPELTEPVARCLSRLGTARAWVVHGNGIDELSLAGPSRVTEVRDGAVRTFQVSPADAAMATAAPETLEGGDAATNAGIARRILEGARGPQRDVVVLNAAAALVVAGMAPSLRDGAAAAGRAIDDGSAHTLLGRLVEASRA